MNSNNTVTNEEQGVGFLKKLYRSMFLIGLTSLSIYSNHYASSLVTKYVLSHFTLDNFIILAIL